MLDFRSRPVDHDHLRLDILVKTLPALFVLELVRLASALLFVNRLLHEGSEHLLELVR